MNEMFTKNLGKTMKLYIDNILVNSKSQEMHMHHLSEAFKVLKKYNMKLNPTKCHHEIEPHQMLFRSKG